MELIITLLLSAIGAQAIRFNIQFKKAFVSKHDLFSSFRALSCPNYCPKTIEPVCGEDGKIYR